MTEYADEMQGIIKKRTREEIESDMKIGESDADVYSEEGIELLSENDEISPAEAGFMEGAMGKGHLGKDALTGDPLIGDDIYETEIEGNIYRFNSEENAINFRLKKGV